MCLHECVWEEEGEEGRGGGRRGRGGRGRWEKGRDMNNTDSQQQGIGIEDIRQNHSIHIHSPEASIHFLFNAHSNSVPYNWDSIQINSSQLCHSMSTLYNFIPFH